MLFRSRDKSSYTGAAYIFVEESTGNNAIIVAPGAASTISPADMDANAGLIGGAKVFVTQLEQPLDAAVRALEIARKHDAQGLFDIGEDIDNACEACHLDFWYPGDRAAVVKDRESTVYTIPKK